MRPTLAVIAGICATMAALLACLPIARDLQGIGFLWQWVFSFLSGSVAALAGYWALRTVLPIGWSGPHIIMTLLTTALLLIWAFLIILVLGKSDPFPWRGLGGAVGPCLGVLTINTVLRNRAL